MIDTHEKFRLTNKIGKSDKDNLFAEVNWSDNEKNCENIRFTLGDKIAVIDKKYLNSMLFAIGNTSDQRKMIPQTLTKVRWYESVIGVKAKKDIRKGETIIFPIKLSIPSVEEEVIQDIKRQKESKSGLILPK